MPNIKSQVEQITKPVIEGMGYEYIDTEFAKQGKDWVLTIYIGGENGISLDDCEKVSRAVDPLLDEKDFIEQQYFLSVSSEGLDRPLKTQRDFERNMGKCVDLKLYKPLDGKKEYSGQITGATGDTLEIRTVDEKTMSIALKDAAKVCLHIEF
ncbi:MAG: ribosome maturation factor RimP [Eubacteriales bacterium]